MHSNKTLTGAVKQSIIEVETSETKLPNAESNSDIDPFHSIKTLNGVVKQNINKVGTSEIEFPDVESEPNSVDALQKAIIDPLNIESKDVGSDVVIKTYMQLGFHAHNYQLSRDRVGR